MDATPSQTVNLSEEAWRMIKEALSGTYYNYVADKMKAKNNQPMRACDVLPNLYVRTGDEKVNDHLRKKEIPYRLVRVGRYRRNIQPFERLLAFVRHIPETKTKAAQ